LEENTLKDRPRIAITMGDPAGVGPEIIVKMFQNRSVYDFACPLIIGDATFLNEVALKLSSDLSITPISSPKEASFSPGSIEVLDLKNIKSIINIGQPSPVGGKTSVEYIRIAVNLAINNEVEAIVTAPINKKSIHMAGFRWPGHTEMLADFTDTNDVALMLTGDALRVVIVTTHVPLSQVGELITRKQVISIIKLTYHWLLEHVTESPRIAVTGLNPHCGDGGIFGEEELTAIIPALDDARKDGINALGPFSADAFFSNFKSNEYDAVITMYHDQGMIPVKMANKGNAVNVTIGLPIIRTSVDHGTAFDIAGKRCASSKSLELATQSAAALTKSIRSR
jgi:4-hydroxythreonine-4-phosphate dehydrogenase